MIGTNFSPDRVHRYTLRRTWANNGARMAMFVGLNPSTADEVQDDPTVRRCINYAKRWGYDGMFMTNIFAFRATDPKVMYAADDPVGPHNNDWLILCAHQSSVVIAAWGTHGAYRGRGNEVQLLFVRYRIPLCALKVTKDGHPAHPLYLRGDLQPKRWR